MVPASASFVTRKIDFAKYSHVTALLSGRLRPAIGHCHLHFGASVSRPGFFDRQVQIRDFVHAGTSFVSTAFLRLMRSDARLYFRYAVGRFPSGSIDTSRGRLERCEISSVYRRKNAPGFRQQRFILKIKNR